MNGHGSLAAAYDSAEVATYGVGAAAGALSRRDRTARDARGQVIGERDALGALRSVVPDHEGIGDGLARSHRVGSVGPGEGKACQGGGGDGGGSGTEGGSTLGGFGGFGGFGFFSTTATPTASVLPGPRRPLCRAGRASHAPGKARAGGLTG